MEVGVTIVAEVVEGEGAMREIETRDVAYSNAHSRSPISIFTSTSLIGSLSILVKRPDS